tara:strand:- start:73 stop:228 length:156 start_codon:yes stop_codon:yes gene_type:complete
VHHLHVPKDSNKNKLGINKEMLEKTDNKEDGKEEVKSQRIKDKEMELEHQK